MKTKTEQAEEVMDLLKWNNNELRNRDEFFRYFNIDKENIGKDDWKQEEIEDILDKRAINININTKRQTMLSCFKEEKEDVLKIEQRLRGYACGYHKELEKQIENLLNDLSSAIKVLDYETREPKRNFVSEGEKN